MERDSASRNGPTSQNHWNFRESQFEPDCGGSQTRACEAIRYIAENKEFLPVGMSIGPFSLMTKLLKDPITPVFLAGAAATAGEEPEVALVERLLESSGKTIQSYLDAQMDAGANAVIVCEPAANQVYFSPNQLARSYDVLDRYAMQFNRAVREQPKSRGVDPIFHDCGELTDGMVQRFATLDAAIMSLGVPGFCGKTPRWCRNPRCFTETCPPKSFIPMNG